MSEVWFCSDWHFEHQKAFCYGPRGFFSTKEMNEAIIEQHNKIVRPGDEVYVLGDLMLNNNEGGMEYFKRMNGHFYIVRGNHDTDNRIYEYWKHPHVHSVEYAQIVKFGKWRFYLSHYPTLTDNHDDAPTRQHLINLHGHIHDSRNFIIEGNPYIFNVAMDTNKCAPWNLEEIKETIEKYKEYCYYAFSSTC